MHCVVTIPAHNEEETIGAVLQGAKKAVPRANIQVVCNDCTDKTPEIVWQNEAMAYKTPVRGLANAFRLEMKAALKLKPDVIVHIDADGQYDPLEIPILLKWYQKGYDLVLGNRLVQRPRGKRWVRYLCNKGGALLYSLALRTWLPDMTTGFRVFSPDVARLPICAENTYTQEQTWRAVKAGMKVVSIPVSFVPRVSGESRLISSAGSYLWKSAKDFWKFSRMEM